MLCHVCGAYGEADNPLLPSSNACGSVAIKHVIVHAFRVSMEAELAS